MVNNSGNQYVGDTWNQRGQSWVEYDGIMNQRLETVSDVLFERIGIPEGKEFLDIGCGAGSTTIRLGNLVSSTASVTGIDISEPMLSLAKEKAKDMSNVDFVLANAQTHEFGRSKFDGAISRFGVMFFSDPVQAFSNIRNVLNEHAFLTFACWPPSQENEFMYILLHAALKHTGKPYQDPGTAPGPQAFSDKDYVKSILDSSGFSGVSIETVKVHIRAKISAEQDASVNMAIGCAQKAMAEAEADEETKGRIYEDLRSVANEHQDGEYVGYDASVNIVSAKV